MRKITIDFGAMTLFDVSVKHAKLCDEYQFELLQWGHYLARLDMKTYKLVKSKHIDNLYKVKRR